MKPPFPSPTPTWHNDVYPAIDPSRPENSHEGQTIIITGAGSGIGREAAIAFTSSGAKHLVLLGRNKSTLTETKSVIPSSSSAKISIFPTDVTDEAAIKKVAGTVGQWDVLVLNAGYISSPAPVATAPLDEWWKNYETNVKSIVIAAQAFLPTANPARASILGVTAGAMALPTKQVAGLSGYLVSKLAQMKIMEYLAVENPNLFTASMHPGMVDTLIFRRSGATPDMLPMDTAQLPAQFLVWLSLPHAQFLNGRFIWANWDVDELKAKAPEIEATNQMTIGFEGWPFPHM